MDKILPPYLVEKARRMKCPLGVLTLMISQDGYQNFLFPWFTPFFIKQRISELTGKDCAEITEYPAPGNNPKRFELEALAEFSWNHAGRSPYEMAASWTVRRGFKKPDEIAEAIMLMEYPSRALSVSSHTRQIETSIRTISSAILSGKPSNSPLRGFRAYLRKPQYDQPEGYALKRMDEMLADCRKAKSLLKKNNSCKELETGAVLLELWVSIFRDYAALIDYRKTENEREIVFHSMQDSIRKLPNVAKAYFDASPVSNIRPQINRAFDKAYKEFVPILNIKNVPPLLRPTKK
jgi:hypothetical protein